MFGVFIVLHSAWSDGVVIASAEKGWESKFERAIGKEFRVDKWGSEMERICGKLRCG